MGTGQTGRNPKAVKLARCGICRRIPTPDCAWRQGRCPHRPPSVFLIRIQNLIKFLTGKT